MYFAHRSNITRKLHIRQRKLRNLVISLENEVLRPLLKHILFLSSFLCSLQNLLCLSEPPGSQSDIL